jgi:hypothetical protein
VVIVQTIVNKAAINLAAARRWSAMISGRTAALWSVYGRLAIRRAADRHGRSGGGGGATRRRRSSMGAEFGCFPVTLSMRLHGSLVFTVASKARSVPAVVLGSGCAAALLYFRAVQQPLPPSAPNQRIYSLDDRECPSFCSALSDVVTPLPLRFLGQQQTLPPGPLVRIAGLSAHDGTFVVRSLGWSRLGNGANRSS